MLIYKHYDGKTKTQEAWYNSSMFIYTKFVEDANENKGDLTVVFKTGGTYIYKGVTYNDYLLVLQGGTDASQGKTLNKIVKGKYDYDKLDDTNIGDLQLKMAAVQNQEHFENVKKENTYFISGHRNITEDEFDRNYGIMLMQLIHNEPKPWFVVGDYEGVDIMAQNYLIDVLDYDPERITVYHMFESPRNINPKITNTKGGYKTDEERDMAMTNDSHDDLAFVRDNTKMSGTGQNILRRYMLK